MIITKVVEGCALNNHENLTEPPGGSSARVFGRKDLFGLFGRPCALRLCKKAEPCLSTPGRSVFLLLLRLKNIIKSFGTREILNIPLLTVHDGQRIGIVGRNGAGKTTLLSIISGDMKPDAGQTELFCDIDYLRQREDTDETVYLSGGEQMRVRLNEVFAGNTPLLLCDEPTANLDSNACEYVETRLGSFNGALLLVSHDRELMDALCNEIWEVRDGTVKVYTGNYSDWRETKRRELDTAWDEYDKYVRARGHLTEAIRSTGQSAQAVRKAPKRMGNSEARLHRRAATESEEKLHKSAKAMRSRLERLEKKDKPRDEASVRMNFALTNPPVSKTVLTVENLTVSFGDRTVLDNISFMVSNGEHLAIRGTNGSGKTTLYREILSGNPCVKTAPGVRFGYLEQSLSELDDSKTALDNVLYGSVQNVQTTRNVLARLLLTAADLEKNTSKLSGGERLKLCLAKILCSEANVLVLDEPTNYLDVFALEALENLIRAYEGTVLFTSHDRRFCEAVATSSLTLSGGGCIYERMK